MKPTRSLRVFLAAAVWLVACAVPALAAGARDQLLRLVPEDVALCLVIQDLRDHAAALHQSPFATDLRESWIGKTIRLAPEVTRLEQIERQFKDSTGIDWPQLRDEILGDCVVLAYRPGPPGKPQEEQGILLVRARNPQLLATLVDRLNAAQKKAGDLERLDELERDGVKYFRRVEKKQAPYYYWLNGPMLAVSPQEALLLQAIDLERKAPAADKDVPPLARRLVQLGVDKALMALWINPRAFDPELDVRAGQAKGNEAAFLKTFLSNWKALDGIALFGTPTEQLEFGMTIRAKPDRLSPGLRKFLAEAARPSELWQAFPDDALLAVAGRIDVPALLDMIGDFLPDNARKPFRDLLEQGTLPAPLGKLTKDVLPNMGPDVGFCVVAPKPDDKGWSPQALWALRVRPGKGEVPADQTLLDTMNFFANLAVFDHNTKHPDRLELKTMQQDKLEVKYFVNDKRFPPGFQPAYAIKEGYLLLASSPESVRSFKIGARSDAGEETPLLRASLTALRSYLKDRREPLVNYLAEKNQLKPEEVVRRLEGLRLGLQFFDRVELVQRSTPEQFTLTWRVKTSAPLRK
jgi:hypothetical protein